MNMINDFNRAINYIEENLERDIDVHKLSQITCCSSFHFMRLFSSVTGLGVQEYIRKRRMTKAAEELQTTDIKIIDLALKYGYNSPTAFNRAFQEIHKLSPSKARHENAKLKSYLPLSFKLTITGEENMEYRIEEIPAFRAVGYKRTYNCTTGENFEKIPLFWDEIMKSGKLDELLSRNNHLPEGTLGICANKKEDYFDYYIASSTDKEIPEGMEEIAIDTQTYAIFTCPLDSAKIQETTRRIYAEWLPNSDYEQVENATDFEIYPEEDTCEICIPIKK